MNFFFCLDPWLKKKKSKSKMKHKVNNKKKKKTKDMDFDEEFDKALAAAGLLKKSNSTPEEPTTNSNHSDSHTNGNLYSKSLLPWQSQNLIHV